MFQRQVGRNDLATANALDSSVSKAIFCASITSPGTSGSLPEAEWQPDAKFSPADELLSDPDLKAVFKEALENGVAVYSPSKPSSQID